MIPDFHPKNQVNSPDFIEENWAGDDVQNAARNSGSFPVRPFLSPVNVGVES
jgi:hypothetical protein